MMAATRSFGESEAKQQIAKIIKVDIRIGPAAEDIGDDLVATCHGWRLPP